MYGINLNGPIVHKLSYLRFFKKDEHHVSRFCPDDVLLLVYDGILRFSENGTQYEIHPGEYFIQKHDCYQAGELSSDEPKYLYVHFASEWTEGTNVLPRSGVFDYTQLKAIIEEQDNLSNSGANYIALAGNFYRLLSKLYNSIKPKNSMAAEIATYIAKECYRQIGLDEVCAEFHFTKNHIINVFKKEYGITPIVYANQMRLRKAEQLMEVTSETIESVASQCGFQNYSHFYRLFYREYGMAPDKWREMRRTGAV